MSKASKLKIVETAGAPAKSFATYLSSIPGFDTQVLFDNLITKERLAEKMECSVSYINKLIPLGLPKEKLPGRAVRFRYLKVSAWVQWRNTG